MSNKPKDGRFRLFGPQYSLRNSLFALILLGILFASLTFVVVRFAGIFVVDRYYVTEENRTKREVRYVTELQSFITDEQLSSADISRVSEWLSLNRFVYVAVYRDDELVFSPDEWGSSQGVPGSPDTGITVKYPSEEELLRYAENGALYPLVFSDQTVACSVAEFTEYLYYDAINLISLVLAMVTLAAIMIVYFHKITVRISRLADDVSVVSGGDMSHVIRADAREDEISDLSRHVEAMRSSIVHTLESERQAVDANTELITAMSHDIRTPLTVLLGYIDVLKLHSESELCASYVKAAEATALRLKELSDDMFRYFVVFGNRLEVTIQSYDAATLLEQLLAEHILLLTEQGYVFEADETSAFPEQASLTTDAPNLMRIIDNIFSNIKKYADPSTPIYIALCAENDNCCLQIRNKVRQDGVPSESTGIGLKTCDRIASAIGSTFEAKREGDVFTVRITLPMSAQEAPKEGKNA
ncbi:MAG: HAMP domain-containing histidine kinase [Clostridia bacterium]|nr:HAMP domain-containing histidine kinase [Clostridia bacterium]